MKISSSAFLFRRNLLNGKIQGYVFPWTCDSRVANFIYLQSVKSFMLVNNLLDDYFRPRAATYVLIQLNAATAVQMFFIKRLCFFFHYLMLKNMGYSPNLIWKFYWFIEIYWVTTFLSNFMKIPWQHHALTAVVRLPHRTKFQIFSAESNMMAKVVR